MTNVRIAHATQPAFSLPFTGDLFPDVTLVFGRDNRTVYARVRASEKQEKMLKMKVAPEKLMKTKDRTTIECHPPREVYEIK